MRPLIKRKLTTALSAAVGAAVLAMGTLAAGALAAPNPGPPKTENPDGPQTANVPYVAWIGEHVRLVACDPSINSNDVIGLVRRKGEEIYDPIQFANFAVEDWSGYQFQPPTPDGDAGNSLGEIFDPGPSAFFASSEPAHEEDGCVATDYKSLNPGLSRIRVDVRNQETDEIVYSHQFLVIWLTVNKPTLSEAGTSGSDSETFQSELNGTGKANLANYLGDPSGNGEFTPSPFPGTWPTKGEDKGLVQIKVTGSFPVVKESPLSNILPGGTGSEEGKDVYTLPTDWVTLADTLASGSANEGETEETEPPGSNPGLWDIHGTPGAAGEGEETAVDSLGDPSEVCTSGSLGPDSSTDNCNGETGESPLTSKFSRVFGDLTSGATATVGPFDPQAANETLLSDGRLNEYDAPMPAMRIDVSIAPNAGGSDLGGVGQISGASKAQIYSHDFTGATSPHNLYNPYYGEYIPATNRPVSEASGIDGPSPGGDFPGFLNRHPEPYTFWESVRSAHDRTAESTGCLRRTDREPSDYQTPGGPLTETFYTDENGEAYVTYTPGDGFYLNHIPVFGGAEGESEAGTIIKNEDGGCDLKGLYEQIIGESSISATAVYPYEPVDYPSVKSAEPVVKKVRSLWEKEWFEFPKGPGKEEQNVRIIVAKAQDIDGYPFAWDTVCFHAEENSGVFPFTGSVVDTKDQLKFGTGTVDLGGTEVVHPDGYEGLLCETTNKEGLAAIEVDNSSYSSVDLTATFIDEGIVRDHRIDFSTNEAGVKEAKEKKEAEEKAANEKQEAKEAAEKKAAEEAAAEKTKNEVEEKAANEKRAKEVEEKKITEAESAEKSAAEKARHEAEEKAANEKRAKEVEEKAKAAAVSLVAPLPGAINDRGKKKKGHGKKGKGKNVRAANQSKTHGKKKRG
jgi:hypothetical protein